MKRRIVICALGLIGFASSATGAGSIPPEPRSPSADAGLSLAGRFAEVARDLLGLPYHNGPLGEGAFGGPDPDPRVDWERVDCVTYLEQCLARALTPLDASLLPVLDAIRYRAGVVGFAERNHFMVTDWLPANSWLVRDVTAQSAPGKTLRIRRTIDRAEFLRGHGVTPSPADAPREATIAVIPRRDAAKAEGRLRTGDLVFWVGDREGIFSLHTGLVARGLSGELLFRHASSRAGQVVDDSFRDYAASAEYAVGFLVLRPRADARVPLSAQPSPADGSSGGNP
ncbi:MAG: DUF1460 domain-containing protein [Gemmatimonadota bacterium]|jgi:D-alanyl-D-alanine carboxypeptidase/D-alanyl-D-alanine-endopeptidase (penicillin-binding protein 4)|nr:DUF1460 domain-containing protein [Gemmatimonadota bacterium]